MNKVILCGRFTKDPECNAVGQNQTSCCNFTIAVDRKQAEQDGTRKADFINCVAWGKRAEFISRYFRKGQRIIVEGQIQTRSWKDQNGQTKWATEVLIDAGEFCEKPQQTQQAPAPVPAPAPAPTPAPAPAPSMDNITLGEMLDGDLPFPLDIM